MTQEELEAEFNVGYLMAFSVLVQDGVDVPQGVPQGVPQDVPQGKKNDTQDDTRDTQVSTSNDTKEENLDDWIEFNIRQNPKMTTEELAKQSGVVPKTIKRHIAKMPHIRYVGSGYSGHWEVLTETKKTGTR